MIRYGFLGLGIMGRAMAANLLDAGLDVTVWNRTKEKCAPLIQAGAKHGETAASVINQCDITFGMVSDPEAAQSLCFGPDGVLAGMTQGKSYIDVSTVDTSTAATISAAIHDKWGRFLEAPVSGSKQPAEQGTLVFLCSGDKTLFEDAAEALNIMGKKSFYFPKIGQGAQRKHVINMIMGTMMTAFAEGMCLAEQVGLEKSDLLEVITQGAINNPMFQLKGPLMARNDFSTAFPLKHMQKDMRLALLMGDSCSQPLNTSSAANTAYIKARQNGYSEEDFSAVIKCIMPDALL